MIAGLPVSGLGLLFFVISALLAPFVELWALARGRSSWARWRAVCHMVITAMLIVAGITAMTVTLLVASRFIDPESLSPPWRRLSDAMVMVLIAAVAGSVVFVFIGLDLLRRERMRPRPVMESDGGDLLPSDAVAVAEPVP